MRESADPCTQYYSLVSSFFNVVFLIAWFPRFEVIELLFVLTNTYNYSNYILLLLLTIGKKGKVHPYTGAEDLYRPYGP